MYTLKQGWTKERVRDLIRQHNDGTKAGKPSNAARSGFACSYQASDGNRCFIGAFIPDNHLGALAHGGDVSDLLTVYDDLYDFLPFDSEDDLAAFQSAHDNAEKTHGGDTHAALEAFLNQCR